MSGGKSRFYRKVFTGNMEEARQQTAIEQAVAPAIKAELLNGRLIDNVSLLAASQTRFEHKLGRKPRGYLIILKSAEATVWDDLKTELKPELFLPLRSSADCTVSIWIF